MRHIVAIAVIVFTLIGVVMIGLPQYRVWAAQMHGRAELSRAEYNRQIIVREAEAQLEAERLNAQAEVVRARGGSGCDGCRSRQSI